MTNLTTAQINTFNTSLADMRNNGELAKTAALILATNDQPVMRSAELADEVCRMIGLPEAYINYRQDGANVHQRGVVGFAVLESNGFTKTGGNTVMGNSYEATLVIIEDSVNAAARANIMKLPVAQNIMNRVSRLMNELNLNLDSAFDRLPEGVDFGTQEMRNTVKSLVA